MKYSSKTNPSRLIFQVSVIALILFMIVRPLFQRNYSPDFEAYCPYGGLLAFSSFLVNNSLACSMTSVQIAMGAALVLAIILFSKLFCSFLCPLGTISEWIGKAGEKAGLRFTLKGNADILLRGVKYALLFITFYYTVSSSELFCRKFDPFYASVTGFSTDVSLLWGIIAIIVLTAGSFFIRLFWCKYICPLGALSNVFRFFLTFVAVMGAYLILLKSGITMKFIWPLALVCCISYILEFYDLKSGIFPIFRIRRNTDICTNCGLCTKYCPQAIDVAAEYDVRHIDCHLCGDCIHVCPEKDALTINKKGRKWLPSAIALVLIAAGIVAGKSFEIPTLSLYWGDENQRGMMAEYSRSGLRSVKCYGSSVAFSNQMKKVEGVTGVITFVKSNTVKIMYIPGMTDSIAIQKAIFTPVRVSLRDPAPEARDIRKFNFMVENFLDPLDGVYLLNLLKSDTSILGFTTSFDCPVRVTVYSEDRSESKLKLISEIIEQPLLDQILTDGTVLRVNLNYRVKQAEESSGSLTGEEYLSRMGKGK